MRVPGMRVTGLPVTQTPRKVRVASREQQKDKVSALWWSSPHSSLCLSLPLAGMPCFILLFVLWGWVWCGFGFSSFAFHEGMGAGRGRMGKKHRTFHPLLIGSRIPLSPVCLPHLWLSPLRSLLSINQRPIQDENFSFLVSSISILPWFLSKSPSVYSPTDRVPSLRLERGKKWTQTT